MIYLSDGRIVRRKIGFTSGSEFEFEKEQVSSDNLPDLRGEQISYWSETEEMYKDKTDETTYRK